MQKALIFANGEPNDGAMVQRALRAANGATIIAADGGARVARFYGFVPHVVIGDMDSLPEPELEKLIAGGALALRHPVDKDATDLELCLQYAATNGARWIRVIGGIGGRFDQVMANTLLMTLDALDHCDAELVAGQQAIRILKPGSHRIEGAAGDTLSLIPIAGDVHEVHTQALRYPLRGETLHFGLARGVSNVMQESAAVVTFAAGMLLLVHFVGRAE
jgi:thiamine pyrophosphokinase